MRINHKNILNKATSIRDRLKTVAKTSHTDFQRILSNYAIQKLLVRIDKSPYKEKLLLKGSWLFVAWNGSLHRPTKDADMLGIGNFNTQKIKQMFAAIFQIKVDDGLVFLSETIEVVNITKDGFYQGFRTTATCLLGNARIKVQVDIGLGDAVSPAPTIETIPCPIGDEKAKLKAYPIYTIISEKWHAINKLGMINSRLKDYFDLYIIASNNNLDGKLLQDAIQNTFTRRNTPINSHLPIGISSEFYHNSDKNKSWLAFLNKNNLNCGSSLTDICTLFKKFLFPINKNTSENIEHSYYWDATALLWLPQDEIQINKEN